jgi:hypothetical protein
MSKTHLALGLLDRLAAQGRTVPVIVADAGYGRSFSFRLALEQRGWGYVMAVDPPRPCRAALPTREPGGGDRRRHPARPRACRLLGEDCPGWVQRGIRETAVTWLVCGQEAPDGVSQEIAGRPRSVRFLTL